MLGCVDSIWVIVISATFRMASEAPQKWILLKGANLLLSPVRKLLQAVVPNDFRPCSITDE
jgi:hypothetical protein